MTERRSDNELVKQIQGGCQDSFEELISRYSSKAFSLASRLTRNQLDAEEVLQDVFVTVYRKLAHFEGKSSFSSWLYRITVNTSFMKLRKRRQDQSVLIEDVLTQVQKTLIGQATESSQQDQLATRHELRLALDEAVRSLPEEYRPVFVLRDIDGLSTKEVCRILNLTVPAVKSRLHRSRLMIRRNLREVLAQIDSDGVVSASNG